MTDRDPVPDRDAGTSHGHAGAAHADASAANRYTSAPHTDIGPADGHASAPACHVDTAAAAHRHADLLTHCTRSSTIASCDWGGRRRGPGSLVDTDGRGDATGLRRGALALAEAEGTERVIL